MRSNKAIDWLTKDKPSPTQLHPFSSLTERLLIISVCRSPSSVTHYEPPIGKGSILSVHVASFNGSRLVPHKTTNRCYCLSEWFLHVLMVKRSGEVSPVPSLSLPPALYFIVFFRRWLCLCFCFSAVEEKGFHFYCNGLV